MTLFNYFFEIILFSIINKFYFKLIVLYLKNFCLIKNYKKIFINSCPFVMSLYFEYIFLYIYYLL